MKIYKFPGYDEEDLSQEAAIIGLAALKKFDPKNGDIEKFLYSAIKNGLHNLKQKHYYDSRTKSSYMIKKKNVIGFISNYSDKGYDHPFEDIEVEEIETIIDRHIHPHMKTDYGKIKEGVYVHSNRKREILLEVKKIYDLLMENNIASLEE